MINFPLQFAAWTGQFLRKTAAPALMVFVCAIGPAVAQRTVNSEVTLRLFESISENNLHAVKINTVGGADLTATGPQGMTPVDFAIDKGYLDIVYYLLAHRDARNKFLSLGNTKSKTNKVRQKIPPPTPAPAPAPAILPPQPEPAVARVYTPPPGSAPWSATVVTSEPPVPGKLPPGPSPFDLNAKAPGSELPIIGDIRTPETARANLPETFATTNISEPVRPVEPSPPVSVAKPTPMPVSKAPLVPLRKPPPPVVPTVKVAVAVEPPPVARPATAVSEPSPLFDDIVQAPSSASVPASGPVDHIMEQQAPTRIVEPVSTTRFNPAPATETPIRTPPSPSQTRAKQPPPEHMLAPVETTLPGKPKDDRGFFGRLVAALPWVGDKPPAQQAARNRVVMDIPPVRTGQARQDNSVTKTDDGWAVKKVETATRSSYPENFVPHSKDRTGDIFFPPLKNVKLSLANGKGLGLSPPKVNSAAFDRSCTEKKSGSLTFCIVELKWPDDIAADFAVSTVLYEGMKSIVRYDEGAATYYDAMFSTDSFAAIVDYFTRLYGPPTKTIERSIAPLASPREPNPTVVWQSIAPVTKILTSLEVRTFDDTIGGFPNTNRGVVLLYNEWSQPIFPHISTIELMMLSSNLQH